MERIIEFRGKLKDCSGWIYGDLVHNAFNGTSKTIEVGIQKKNMFPIEVMPETVGQFTGYKMRTIDVYFGDLVSNNYKSDREVIREIVLDNGYIMMKRVKGKSKLPKLISLHEHHKLNYVIIGNIHDN